MASRLDRSDPHSWRCWLRRCALRMRRIRAAGSVERSGGECGAGAPLRSTRTTRRRRRRLAEEPPKVPLLEQDLAYGEAQKTQPRRVSRDAARRGRAVARNHRDPRVVGAQRQHQGRHATARGRRLRRARRRPLRRQDRGHAGGSAGFDDRARRADPKPRARNLRQAYEYLEKYAFAPRIGSIGWDLGGGWSLQTGLLYPDQLDAMVMYYGQLA